MHWRVKKIHPLLKLSYGLERIPTSIRRANAEDKEILGNGKAQVETKLEAVVPFNLKNKKILLNIECYKNIKHLKNFKATTRMLNTTRMFNTEQYKLRVTTQNIKQLVQKRRRH